MPAIERGPSRALIFSDGRIAQLVEQLTLNQRVLGSSPSAPTNKRRAFSAFPLIIFPKPA